MPGGASEPRPIALPGIESAIAQAYADAEVLAASEKLVGGNANRTERVRVVKTKTGKYPLIRIVETIERDPSSLGSGAGERVLRRAAMVADHILVKVRPGLDKTLLAGINARHGTTIRKKMLAPDTYLIALNGYAPEAVPEAIAAYQREVNAVAYAEPDFIAFTCRTPNDPRYGELWGMNNTGGVGAAARVEQGATTFSAYGLAYAGATTSAGVTGVVYHCGLGKSPTNFPAAVNGNIALIQRGDITFEEKATRAMDAGAVAAIIYNNVSGGFQGTLENSGNWIPVVSVSMEDGAAIVTGSIPARVINEWVDADIDAPEAWDINTGSRSILVGVIDTGIDYNHPDLASNIWVNAGETGLDAGGRNKASNGIDDDGNGLIDDWHGWDFCNDDNDPFDDHHHGTHVAGTIGAVGNNEVGVVGVCWNVSLVGIKFLDFSGSGGFSDAVDAIYYATSMRVRLTSNSWGSDEYSQALADAIEDANRHGILFVAAAGNNSKDADVTPMYPGANTNANIISVAALDDNDRLASFSNYGATSVDLGAPGVNILSCAPAGGYQVLSGTSMATPHVAGACALMMSMMPGLTHMEVRSRILGGVDPIPALAGKSVTGGRLNIGNTLALRQPYVVLKESTMHDGSQPGTSGDGDGVPNPGERTGLAVVLRNLGSETATGVTARLVLATNDAYVTVLTGAAPGFGDIPPASDRPGTNVYLVDIAPATPTPHPVSFALIIDDSSGHSWTQEVTMAVDLSSHISGVVRLDGSPVAGVRVEFSGPRSGVTVSGTNGAYMFGGTAGAYSLVAGTNGWLDTSAMLVTVPPATSGVDFAFTTATISGRVTDTLTGNPIEGVTVQYTGPLSGSTMTGSDGRYSIARVYGRTATLRLVAKYPGYFDSPPRDVTVPGDASNVDFQMGVGDLRVSPSSLDVTLAPGSVVTQWLSLANVGGAELTWSAWMAPGIGVPPGGKVVTQFAAPAGVTPTGVAYDGNVLWLSGYLTGQLYKLDPTNGQILGTLSITNACMTQYGFASPYGLAWDGTNLWIAGDYDRKLHAVDRLTGAEVKRLASPADIYPVGVAWDGAALWAKAWLGTGGGAIYRVNADDGSILRKIFQPVEIVNWTLDLTCFNGALWSGTWGDNEQYRNRLYKFSPVNGRLISSFRHFAGAFISGICDDGQGGLWLADWQEKKMSRVTSGEALWLNLDAFAGTVPRTNSASVAVIFDARKANPGAQQAILHIESNDRDQPDVAVPVTLTVSAPYTISGTVRRDGVPLSGAAIAYTGPNDGEARTGTNGTYIFYAGTGTYSLVASHTGDLATPAVPVTIPPSRANVDFAFTTATISGRVTNRLTGAAIEGATVEFAGALTGAVQTAADGRYSFTRAFGQTAMLSVTAKHPSYYDSRSRAVTAPPDAGGIDFGLGVPDFTAAPAEIEVVAGLHQVVTRSLALTNLGGSDLDWSITGGTNYVATASTVPGGPAYSWIEISGTGTRIDGLVDNNNVGPFPLGFEFPFYGGRVTTFRLSPNGWLSFTNSGGYPSNQRLPSAYAPENVVAFFWDDLTLESSGAAYYQLLDAQTLVVEFKDVSYHDYPVSKLTCEAILQANGRITFQYKLVGGANSCTIGIQNETRDQGVTVSYNDGYPRAGLAVRIEPAIREFSLSSNMGVLPAASATNIALRFLGTAAGLGITTNVLHVYSNDPDSNDVPVTVIYTVTNDNRAVQIAGFSPPSPHTMPEYSSQTFQVTASDPDGDPLTYGWTLDGATIGGATNASWIYSPGFGTAGSHTLAATVDDGWGGGTNQTWQIVVVNGNRAPVALDQAVATAENMPRDIVLTATDPDGDALTYAAVSAPGHGTLTGTPPAVTYRPSAGYYGPDTFTFRANDGKTNSNVATVSVTVEMENAIPYQETFEAMAVGRPILDPAATNGWYGDRSAIAFVTNMAYTLSGLLHPVESATHTNVLTHQNACLTNRFEPCAAAGAVTVDFMAQSLRRASPPATSAVAGTQTSLYVDTNGLLNVWYGRDAAGTNNAWMRFAHTPLDPAAWARVTVVFDYTRDTVHHGAYFQVSLNGISQAATNGLGHVFDAGQGVYVVTNSGTWLLSAAPARQRIASFEVAGSGLLDDLVVTPDGPSAFFPAPAGFHLLTSHAGPRGSITPASTNVPSGGSASFVVAASKYYRIAALATNGGSVGMTLGNHSTVTNFAWGNVQTSGTLTATFTAQVAGDPASTPYWWLAQYGCSNNFDASAAGDPDADGLQTWQEYVAGTIPTSSASVFAVASVSGLGAAECELRWHSAANRFYAIDRATNLLPSAFSPVASNLPPTPPLNVYTDVVPGGRQVYFYRIRTPP